MPSVISIFIPENLPQHLKNNVKLTLNDWNIDQIILSSDQKTAIPVATIMQLSFSSLQDLFTNHNLFKNDKEIYISLRNFSSLTALYIDYYEYILENPKKRYYGSQLDRILNIFEKIQYYAGYAPIIRKDNNYNKVELKIENVQAIDVLEYIGADKNKSIEIFKEEISNYFNTIKNSLHPNAPRSYQIAVRNLTSFLKDFSIGILGTVDKEAFSVTTLPLKEITGDDADNTHTILCLAPKIYKKDIFLVLETKIQKSIVIEYTDDGNISYLDLIFLSRILSALNIPERHEIFKWIGVNSFPISHIKELFADDDFTNEITKQKCFTEQAQAIFNNKASRIFINKSYRTIKNNKVCYMTENKPTLLLEENCAILKKFFEYLPNKERHELINIIKAQITESDFEYDLNLNILLSLLTEEEIIFMMDNKVLFKLLNAHKEDSVGTYCYNLMYILASLPLCFLDNQILQKKLPLHFKPTFRCLIELIKLNRFDEKHEKLQYVLKKCSIHRENTSAEDFLILLSTFEKNPTILKQIFTILESFNLEEQWVEFFFWPTDENIEKINKIRESVNNHAIKSYNYDCKLKFNKIFSTFNKFEQEENLAISYYDNNPKSK